MAIQIPQGPRVSPGAMPTPYSRLDARGTFGEQEGEALQRVGASVDRVSGALAEIAAQAKRQQDVAQSR